MGLKYAFVVLSDHKNLEYFMTTRKLSERQICWSYTLSQYNFELKFRMGKSSQRPDALSRREQDMPCTASDERLKYREIQLIKDSWIKKDTIRAAFIKSVISSIPIGSTTVSGPNTQSQVPEGKHIFQQPELQILWNRGCAEDLDIKLMYRALRANERTFPAELKLKVSISECDFDERGVLCFRQRVWVPNWEPLQTALQQTHNSYITGHPGRDSTYAILSRNFFWPGASSMVRSFCKNCDVCGRSHVRREKKQGLLLPLPVPDRFHSELSIDFMTDLPARSKQDSRYLMVITDRLLKSCTLEAFSWLSEFSDL